MNTTLMDIQSLYRGFLFGVRVANHINGNTVDIEIKTIADKLVELASSNTTIQSTGAELKHQFAGFTIPEVVIRDLVSRDQQLAALILSYLQNQLKHTDPGNTSS